MEYSDNKKHKDLKIASLLYWILYGQQVTLLPAPRRDDGRSNQRLKRSPQRKMEEEKEDEEKEELKMGKETS